MTQLKNKLIDFQSVIGRTVSKIEDDGSNVRIHFTDGTFFTIESGSEGLMSIDDFERCTEVLSSPVIYE